MRKLHYLLLSTLLPMLLQAQDSVTWNLKTCIGYGLKNNRNKAIYYNDKLAADENAKELLAAYLPSVSLTGNLDDNLKVQQSLIPAGTFIAEDTWVAFSKQYSINGTAQLEQTIFDKSLLVGLKARKYNKQQADLNTQQSEETIIYNIAKSYYQILVFREQLKILQTNLITYEGQESIALLQVTKGTLLQKELDKVRVDRNNTLSKIRVAESNLQLAGNQLKYDMGMPIDAALQIDTLPITQIQHPVENDFGRQGDTFSASNRIDYQLNGVNAQLDEINAEKIKAGIYPKLTAYAKYGVVGFGDNIGQSFRDKSTFSAIGLKLSVPILDFYKRNAQYKQAKFKSLNDQEQLKLNEGKYRLEYENAKNKITQESGNVMMDKNNMSLAHSILQTTDLQYKKGVTDMTDWLNAQNSLKESQTNYLNSLYNWMMAKVELEKSAGTLKNFYNSL